MFQHPMRLKALIAVSRRTLIDKTLTSVLMNIGQKSHNQAKPYHSSFRDWGTLLEIYNTNGFMTAKLVIHSENKKKKCILNLNY